MPARGRRFAGGTRSPIQLVADGAQAASPTPTPRREIRPAVGGHQAAKAVSALQTAMPPAEQFLAGPQVGDAAQGHADDGVEHGERGSQQAHLGVVQVKLPAHGFDQRAGDVAIVEVEDVDEE